MGLHLDILLPELSPKGTHYWVTHTERITSFMYPDPPLSKQGRIDAKKLKERLTSLIATIPKRIVAGTGLRHQAMASVMRLQVSLFTPVVGIADAGITYEGKSGILLPNQRFVKPEEYDERALAAGAISLLNALPSVSVILGSRFADLGIEKSGAIYKVSQEGFELIFAL